MNPSEGTLAKYVLQAYAQGLGFVDVRECNTIQEAQQEQERLHHDRAAWMGGRIGRSRIAHDHGRGWGRTRDFVGGTEREG